MKHKLRKPVTWLLTLAMIFTMLPGFAVTASAVGTDTGKAIQLGTSGISDPTSTQDSSGTYYTPSDYVYFGVNGSDPIKWRVLDADKANNSTSGMFLLSEYLLASGVVFESAWNSDDNDGQTNPNEWQYSDAQSWCSTFATNKNAFSTAEQAAFLGVTKNDTAEYNLYSISWGESRLTADDKVFFLSVRELADYVGDYDYALGLIAYTDSTQSSADIWWLRSPDAGDTDDAGTVHMNGYVYGSNVLNGWAVRPAFNLNLNSVLFTSAANGSAQVSFGQVQSYSDSEWKVTLKDGNSFAVDASVDKSTLAAGETLTVSHKALSSFTDAGYNNVTAMLTDSSGDILYYGSINSTTDATQSTITIPAGLTAGEYTLSVYGEDWNGEKLTDYATGTPFTTTISVTTAYALYVGDVALTDGQYLVNGATDTTATAPESGGYAYCAVVDGTPTLTLNGFSYSAADTESPIGIGYSGTDTLNLVLEGQNSITLPDGNNLSFGIVSHGSLSVTGSGSLTITGVSVGIGVSKGDLTIADGCTVNVNGDKFGIWLINNDVSLENPEFEAADDEQTNVLENEDSDNSDNSARTGYALRTSSSSDTSGGNVTVSGSTVTIKAGEIGIYVDGMLSVKDGSVIDITGAENCALAVLDGFEMIGEIVTLPENPVSGTVNLGDTAYMTYGTETVEDEFAPAIRVRFEPVYTVFFSISTDDFDWQEVVAGGKVEKPEDPTLDGYIFGGWYIDEACTQAYDFGAEVTEDLWLYAKWTKAVIDNGTPGVPGTPTYTPTVNTVSGGSVTVSDKTPAKGDVVTIIPVPDAGFAVDEVTVTDKYGKSVAVADNGNGTYSFVQPSGKVTITVTFKEIDTTCPRDWTCPMYGYTDLDRTEWYHDGVHFCFENGLMQGIGNNQFNPNGTTTRAMIVTILWRLEGEPTVNGSTDFTDVADVKWYSEAIKWAASEKIVEGYGDGKFGTNDAITREQMVTIMFRYAKYKGYDVSVGENTNILSYDDAFDVADWAIPAMQWACGESMIQGIADGSKMNLAPQGSATRAQAAAILQRFIENVVNEK